MENRLTDYYCDGRKESVNLTNESPETLSQTFNIKKQSVMEADLNHIGEENQKTIRGHN